MAAGQARAVEATRSQYIVSPAYVFDMGPDGGVLYDDSLVLQEDWDRLATAGWRAVQAMPALAQREEAMRRLSESKKKGPE